MGTFHDTSPASFAAAFCTAGPFIGTYLVAKPSTGTLTLACSDRASSSSSLLQRGRPTSSISRSTSSARVRLPRTGQTALITSTSTVVLDIKAAPCAIFLACSNSLPAPSAVESRKYHHTAALRGTTLG